MIEKVNLGNFFLKEHLLKSIERLVNGTAYVQQAVPDVAVIGTDYSRLSQFSPYPAVGSLENKYATLIGYDRESIAYPGFPKDFICRSKMQKQKCCIACDMCVEIMSGGGPVGCVIRDSNVYTV
jgi:2,4-dienoyl-CoA reductase-like NADH-dependent reductase (Old Yellow Enzyme family)